MSNPSDSPRHPSTGLVSVIAEGLVAWLHTLRIQIGAMAATYALFFDAYLAARAYRGEDWRVVALLNNAAPWLMVGVLISFVVLCFSPYRRLALVAHRVTGLVAGGAILRGDGNSRCDVDTVFEQDLLGRVSYYERNGKVRPVANGPRGLARARLLHLWYGGRRTLWRSVTFVGRIPYRWFKRSGIVRYVWQIPIERILLQTPDGPLIKYVHRGRTVAQWWPETGKMIYVRPYDLVIPRPDDATHTNDQTPNANSRANIPVAGPKSE
jgi:hypothetical protein